MKISVLVIILILSLKIVHSQNSGVAFYAMPRHATWAFFDNGIYRFELNKKSICANPNVKSYYVPDSVEKDTLTYLFYKQLDEFNLTNTLNEFSQEKEICFRLPRALIIFGNSLDTLEISEDFVVRFKQTYFQANDYLINILENNLPPDLYYNWFVLKYAIHKCE